MTVKMMMPMAGGVLIKTDLSNDNFKMDVKEVLSAISSVIALSSFWKFSSQRLLNLIYKQG